jgi:hypothetical protein
MLTATHRPHYSTLRLGLRVYPVFLLYLGLLQKQTSVHFAFRRYQHDLFYRHFCKSE